MGSSSHAHAYTRACAHNVSAYVCVFVTVVLFSPIVAHLAWFARYVGIQNDTDRNDAVRDYSYQIGE